MRVAKINDMNYLEIAFLRSVQLVYDWRNIDLKTVYSFVILRAMSQLYWMKDACDEVHKTMHFFFINL